jgi:predicted translin family RNA/ssDNA-binding protein
MTHKIDLRNLRKEYDTYDKYREAVIIQSRAVLKAAKLKIYALHSNSNTKSTLKEEFKKLQKKVSVNKKLLFEGSYAEACQEYGEAELYSDYISGKKFRTFAELEVTPEDYLAAVADLTGELVRKAVHETIKENYDKVYEIHEFVSNIYAQFLKFSFRNSSLRKKSDTIKWNLHKIEDIVYDIHKLQSFLKK